MGSKKARLWKPRAIRPQGIYEVIEKKREVARIRKPQFLSSSVQDLQRLQQDIFKDLATLQKISQNLSFYLSQLVDE